MGTLRRTDIKMIREIISMPRADLGHPHNFIVNSWVFMDDESESDAKINSRHGVCLLLVGSPLLAWRIHAQSPLLAHCVKSHTHLSLYVTFPPRADRNFLTHFTGKCGPSIFKWSALSMRSADWNV